MSLRTFRDVNKGWYSKTTVEMVKEYDMTTQTQDEELVKMSGHDMPSLIAQADSNYKTELYAAALRIQQAAITRLREEVNELQSSFDLRWNANMRAIKRWHDAGNPELTWPDSADLTVWLLEQNDVLRQQLAEWQDGERRHPDHQAEIRVQMEIAQQAISEQAGLRIALKDALAAGEKMLEAAEDVCKTLEHPTKSVNAFQMWKLREALDAPVPTLAEHDAEVRRKALEEVIALWDAPYKQGFGTFIEQLRRMAAEKGTPDA